MASLTVQVRVEREGLLMKLYTGEKLLTTVDLKEIWKLSDEQAALLLQKLEEKSTCPQ